MPVPGPRGAIGVGWFASATHSRAKLLKHLFAIEIVCIAGFYRLKDLVAPPEEPTQGRLTKRRQGFGSSCRRHVVGGDRRHAPHLRSDCRLARQQRDG